MKVIEWLVNRTALVQELRQRLDEVEKQRDLLLERARGGAGALRAVDPPTVRDDRGPNAVLRETLRNARAFLEKDDREPVVPRCRGCRGAGVVEQRAVWSWESRCFFAKAQSCPECGGVGMSEAEKERLAAQCARIEELLMERENGNRGGAEIAERRVTA